MAEKLASLSEFMKRIAPPPKYAVRRRDGRFKPKPKQDQPNV